MEEQDSSTTTIAEAICAALSSNHFTKKQVEETSNAFGSDSNSNSFSNPINSALDNVGLFTEPGDKISAILSLGTGYYDPSSESTDVYRQSPEHVARRAARRFQNNDIFFRFTVKDMNEPEAHQLLSFENVLSLTQSYLQRGGINDRLDDCVFALRQTSGTILIEDIGRFLFMPILI